MNRKIFIGVSLLSTALLASAATNPTAIAQKWATCVSKPDIPCLETLLSDNYMHTHATALVENKEQFIAALSSGARKYDPIHFEQLQSHTTDKTGIVMGQFNLKATTKNGVIESVNRFGLVVVDTLDGEEVVYFQATPVKGK